MPLLDFVPALTPAYRRPDHLARLARALELTQTQKVEACCSAPPRHGKTDLLLHAVAWRLKRDPRLTVGFVSYAADLAFSKSRLARDYAIRAGVQLRGDSNAVHEWRTTDGGGMIAAGVGGVFTGQGVGLLIVDDPFANRAQAESPQVRQQVHEWFTSTAFSRVEPAGSTLVTHTRWHLDDLIGRLSSGVTPDRQKTSCWPWLNLPAIDHAGAPLWPGRWSLEELQKKRAASEYDWASLYQGDPRPRGGQLFGEPARYSTPVLDNARLVIACDPAASQKTHADYSAIVVLAVRGSGAEMTADVLEVFRRQVEIPTLVGMLADLQARHACPVVVEAVGGFRAVPQMLRALDDRLDVVEIQPATDKFIRAQAVAAAWGAGRVRLPIEAPWLVDFMAEARTFTGLRDPHDDQVDALAHAWNYAAEPQPWIGTLEEVSDFDG